MGSVGSTQPSLTLTEKLVNKISDKIIGSWIEDSAMDADEIETIQNWHDLLEHLDMTASEARQYIIEELDSDSWDYIYNPKIANPEDRKLVFDDDGSFETENGDFMKYGEVMKLVKKRLASKGLMQKGN